MPQESFVEYEAPGSLLKEYNTLQIQYRALLREYRALLREYRALLREYKALVFFDSIKNVTL